MYGKLVGHKGCVNTVEFNSTGKVLISGSDDRQVIFWNWASKKKIFTYSSGHLENIFQTKIMPFSDDRVIVTSAQDGQVLLTLKSCLFQNFVIYLLLLHVRACTLIVYYNKGNSM